MGQFSSNDQTGRGQVGAAPQGRAALRPSRPHPYPRLSALAGCLLLAACGGGGNADDAAIATESAQSADGRPAAMWFATRVPPRANAQAISHDAALADTLVALADQGAENWANAQVATASLLGAGTLNAMHFGAPPAGSGADGAATPMCDSGSATVQAAGELVRRMQRSEGRDWQAGDVVDLRFDHCDVEDGNLGLVHLADNAVIDGRVQLSVARFNSTSDYAASLLLSGLSLGTGGIAATLALDLARFSVDYTPLALRTVLDTGSQAYLDGQVSVQGQRVLVAAGVWRTLAPPRDTSLAGWVDLDYGGWQHDRALQRSVAGSVQVLGSAGALATITAESDGVYTVSINGADGLPAALFRCAPQQGCEAVDAG